MGLIYFITVWHFLSTFISKMNTYSTDVDLLGSCIYTKRFGPIAAAEHNPVEQEMCSSVIMLSRKWDFLETNYTIAVTKISLLNSMLVKLHNS